MKKKNIQDEMLHASDDEEFLESTIYDEDENPDDYEKDDELLQKIKQLSGIKSKRLRTEIVSDELDVNVTGSSENDRIGHRIKAHELISSLKNVSNVGSLKKVLSKAHKRTKVLETPLPKHISDKAHRVAAYTADSKEVSKWDPIVQRNRKAEQLVFPLKQPDYAMKTATEVVKTWKPETDLEKEVAELLQSSENYIKDQKLLTQAELKGLESMSLDELKEKRAEFLRFKALQTYQEQKFKRVKKIKSKKYRKILRKEKQKNDLKDLESLAKNDPSEFKEKYEQMEKQRMQERMSLKHKNTSKWAKQQTVYGKYNLKAREEVQEQLELSRQLTKKLNNNAQNGDENSIEAKKSAKEVEAKLIQNIRLESAASKNPWISFVPVVVDAAKENEAKTKTEEEYVRPKAFVDKDAIESAKRQLEDDESDDSDDDDNYDDVVVRQKTQETESESSDSEVEEEEAKVHVVKAVSKKKVKKPKTAEITVEPKVPEVTEGKKETKQIDPNKILVAEKDDYDIKEAEDEVVGENGVKTGKYTRAEDKHLLTLSEAFADDDVIAEFRLEKKSIVDNEKVKPIDLTLPGWGDWTGAGVDPKKQKKRFKRNNKYKKRLIIKPAAHEKQLRRDKDLENVIISEKKDKRIAEFQISELPHQFNNIEDFQKKISQPIGRTWNTETKYRKLVQPKVVTRVGKVIEPIEKDDVVLNKKTKK